MISYRSVTFQRLSQLILQLTHPFYSLLYNFIFKLLKSIKSSFCFFHDSSIFLLSMLISALIGSTSLARPKIDVYFESSFKW